MGFKGIGLAVVVFATACANPDDTSVVLSRQDAHDALQLVQQRDNSVFVTKLGKLGSVTTELAGTTPLHGGIVRYDDHSVVALDYASQTLIRTTLEDAVADHRARLDARQNLLGSLGAAATPPAPITRSNLHAKIAGLEAHAFITTMNGMPERVWYAAEGPKPPHDVRELLAQLTVTDTTQPVKDDCDDDDVSSAADLSGRVLLRSEIEVNGVWTTQLDTSDVSSTTLSAAELEPPSGWTSVDPALARVTPQSLAPTSPTAFAVSAGGPVLRNLEVHAFYWGPSFADPAHADAVHELDNAIRTITGDGFGSLGQYSINPGKLVSSHIIGSQPPASVLQDVVSFLPVSGFVSGVMAQYGPAFWWKWGPDPLILVAVNPDDVGSTASFSGYHLDYFTPAFLMPFPIDLMSRDFMPYALVTVDTNALELPAGAIANRDACPGAGCGAIASFDDATVIFSHEIIEAATDPYPFFGWADLSKLPWFTESELADLCEDSPFERTRLNDYVVSTFWSNADGDCIGNYRSSIQLVEPRGTFSTTVAIHGTATASAAIDRGNMLEHDVRWTIDGVFAQYGLTPNLGKLGAGSHHVVVTLTDDNGYSASDSADITVDAACSADFGNNCGSCGGTVACDDSCTIGTPGDFGQSCGSCGGSVQCDENCSIATPGDFGQACGCGGSVQCDDSCSSYCGLEVDFSNIDDDSYIWLDTPGFTSDPASAIYGVNTGSTPRSGQFDLGDWMRSQGMESATFIVKIGNGGCFNSHGDISFVMGGVEQWHGHKGDTGTFTHCGWTYRAVVTADLRADSVTLDSENFCQNVTDCPY